jgi:predicted Zn-dependent protease
MRRRLALPSALAFLLCHCGAPLGRPTASQRLSGQLPAAAKTLHVERRVPASSVEPAVLLGLLARELDRAKNELARADPPVYYLAYTVTERRRVVIAAASGALATSVESRDRVLDVDLRVGDRHLDNTHSVEEAGRFDGVTPLPLEDDQLALESALWLATDSAYLRAQTDLTSARAHQSLRVAQHSSSDDFSVAPPVRHFEPIVALDVDRPAWEERVRRYSALLTSGRAERAEVELGIEGSTRWLVSSDGTRLQTSSGFAKLTLQVAVTAADGSELARRIDFVARSPDRLKSDAEIRLKARLLSEELELLRRAPVGEPYLGPAILDGPAAAVLFHEIFGHRVEGHRQKSELEGQTFVNKIGEPIMPPVFDVYDDPAIIAINGSDLVGHYLYDDEGVRGARATLIDDGIFRGFLMSRSPIRGFARSNGHGRRQPGHRVVARQANLMIDPVRVTTPEALRRALVSELKRQGKPYALRVSDVSGGYTLTGRESPQSFIIEPTMVYRVYPDGRQELIRGVVLEGMPLGVLAEVVAAANDFAIFNGACGAESGDIPVAAVSPSLLVSRIEATLGEKAGTRPPLLPPPVARSP